ncbi:MAG TPA: OmpA family protein [Terracidiphilus sp.]|jgi:chemotaxis protein MotB|nr:OmpA family protein [Terracidiphilus sp.]
MRRKKYISEEHVSHDRWLVSYADFITLLFAFFVVLFASAYRDKKTIIRVSNAVHNGFQALGVFPGGSAKDAIAYSGLPVDSPEGPPPGLNKHDGAGPRPGIPAPDLLELSRQLKQVMGDELKTHEVEMSFTPEGFVISLKELGFFNSGQAQLLPGAAEKIVRIARILSNHNLELRVEGHSDNQPIHNTQFRSNWELSTARAMSVLLILVNDAGYDPKKVSVAGYGQYRPIADDSTPEGRRMNRRVDLVVIGAAPVHSSGQ